MVYRLALSLIILATASFSTAAAQCPCGPGCYCGPNGQCICPGGFAAGYASAPSYGTVPMGYGNAGSLPGYGAWHPAVAMPGMAFAAPAVGYYGAPYYSAPAYSGNYYYSSGLFGRRRSVGYYGGRYYR